MVDSAEPDEIDVSLDLEFQKQPTRNGRQESDTSGMSG